MEPNWIPKNLVFALHNKLLHRYGGSNGVRDEGLLESALSRPERLYHYEEACLYAIAASYCFRIVKNHPFIDGNKRTGFMAAFTFLGVNGHHLIATEADALIQNVGLASSAITEQ